MALGGWDILLRLVLAAVLGAVVGFERELHEREAGTRTHLLVALGACLFTIVGGYGFHDVIGGHVTVDPSRVSAQIVSGIGFLGAGAILRQGLTVRGLTTAGSLWIVAAIGLATGAGAYWAAIAATVLTLVALWPLRVAAYRLAERTGARRPGRLELEVAPGQSLGPLLDELGALRNLAIVDEPDRRVVTVELVGDLDYPLVTRLADLPYVRAARQVR